MSGDDETAKKLQEILRLLQLNNNDITKLSSQQRKDMKDYKFWKTQPVPNFDEKIVTEGPIDKLKTPEDISDKPLPMVEGFEWSSIDISDSNDLENVFVLLNENYVEDRDAEFRFNYSKEFFNWALKPMGWRRDWNVGVRVKNTGKLVAFISAIPVTLKVRGKTMKSVEINFLCIHKQLRSKRLAPVLIKEITRRVNKQNIWQALYTAGSLLPSPISVCRYTHRPLNWAKLHDVGFTPLPPNATKTEMVAKYALPKKTVSKGLRPLKLEDIDETLKLFNKFQERFEITQDFTKEEFTHWMLGNTEQKNNVIFSYVIENDEGKITDFFSFYSLPFSILNNQAYKDLGVGYLFYYATDADFKYSDRYDTEASDALKKRLTKTMNDACILAHDAGLDVFNAMSSQENNLFVDELKFGLGDGLLNFYLFNYKAFPVSGGLKKDNSLDYEKRSNVGVVML